MKLPKFLICRHDDDEPGDRLFVLHCHPPRFISEFVPGCKGEIELIDTDSVEANDGTVGEVTDLLIDGRTWMIRETSWNAAIGMPVKK